MSDILYSSTKKVAEALDISRESAGRLLLKKGWKRHSRSSSKTVYYKEKCVNLYV